ncbi:MAG TPA: hypothetical protein VK777_16785 [Reyranella sp.]|jgi:hypothetical protein|nr:hypothetical protein [Reyranella sp.]
MDDRAEQQEIPDTEFADELFDEELDRVAIVAISCGCRSVLGPKKPGPKKSGVAPGSSEKS